MFIPVILYFVIFLHVTSYLLTNIVNLSVAVSFLFVYFKRRYNLNLFER